MILTMKTLILLALILLTTGCGKAPSPEFQPYVDRFNQEARAQGGGHYVPNDVTIQFGELSNLPHTETNGYTGFNFDGITITISPDCWAKASEIRREQIMFHEFGHAVLLREHSTATAELDGEEIPASVMMPLNFPHDETWTKYRARYVHELFHPGNF